MTDDNAPVVRSHRRATERLAALLANRETVQARTAAWTANVPQSGSQPLTAPETESTS